MSSIPGGSDQRLNGILAYPIGGLGGGAKWWYWLDNLAVPSHLHRLSISTVQTKVNSLPSLLESMFCMVNQIQNDQSKFTFSDWSFMINAASSSACNLWTASLLSGISFESKNCYFDWSVPKSPKHWTNLSHLLKTQYFLSHLKIPWTSLLTKVLQQGDQVFQQLVDLW